MAINLGFLDEFCCFTGLHPSQVASKVVAMVFEKPWPPTLEFLDEFGCFKRVTLLIVHTHIVAMVLEKPWPDCEGTGLRFLLACGFMPSVDKQMLYKCNRVFVTVSRTSTNA